MHSKRGNINFTSCNDANNVVAELFDSFCLRYHDNLETSMRVSNCFFLLFSSIDVLQMP